MGAVKAVPSGEQNMTRSEDDSYNVISKQCNYMGTDLAEVGRLLAHDHPTLQQNFFRIVIGFIEAQSEKTYCDLRNEATVEQCKKFRETYPEDGMYLPYV